MINWERERSSHWTLIIFSNKYYMNLLTLVLGMNAQIPVDKIDQDVRYDTFVVNIGYCLCGEMTYADGCIWALI